MKKIEFEVLRLIDEKKGFNLDIFADELFKSKEIIEKSYKFLINQNYVNKNQITDNGLNELNKYKIDNAIILAAGKCTRFAPLNYEIPKGLLEVKGIPLVERQIIQLKEKGIDEIIIVVGYMKESFGYLINKYNVKLIESKEYETRNNHSSVYAAREYLKNSIVTSSDLYFEKNIFQKYAYDSYYCSIFKSGETTERGLELNDDDLIIETFYGDRCVNVWVTLGYAFFSESFSNKIINIIEEKYNDKEIINKFWADIQDDNLKELYMYAKKCYDNVIYEFDSLEELREFDTKYINNSGSKILIEISRLLNIEEKDIFNIKSLKNIKETVFEFEVGNKKYICDLDKNAMPSVIHGNKTFYKFLFNEEGSVNLYEFRK